MDVIGIDQDDQETVWWCVAGVIHLGNIQFVEQGNYATVQQEDCKCFKIEIIAIGISRNDEII